MTSWNDMHRCLLWAEIMGYTGVRIVKRGTLGKRDFAGQLQRPMRFLECDGAFWLVNLENMLGIPEEGIP